MCAASSSSSWRKRQNAQTRSEEHTSELQSRPHLVCRLLLEKKKRREARSRLRGSAPREVIKTALTVEARGGHVRVFMPPLTRMEAYAALIATIEDTAAALTTPVVIEGYAPPRDARVRVLQVTPDPGVIEVNIHPFFFFNDTAATEIYTLSLHDALPI